MSATMFIPRNDHNTLGVDHSSRIPISMSPLPLRRSHSLRLRGEKTSQNHIRFCDNPPSKLGNGVPQDLGCSTPSNGMAHTRLQKVPADLREVRTSHLLSRKLVDGCNHLKTDFRSSSTPKGVPSPHTPRTKTLSLSLSTTKLHNQKSPTISLPSTTPPTSPYGTNHSNLNHDWDSESLGSTTSNLSLSSCDHAAIARNGTTFSGRSMRYIFHCNQNAAVSGEEYLTPTQRAHRQIKKLKSLLHQAQIELEQKDSDILKLTKEVVELRLYKAAICSPDDRSNSSDAVTVRENNSDEQITPEGVNGNGKLPNCLDSGGSHIDSGHFEDLNRSCTPERVSFDESDSIQSPEKSDKAVETCDFGIPSSSEQKLILEYEKRIQELIKIHEEENYQMKQKQNDKIEELLARIGDINQRYWQVVPELEAAKERIKDLEKQLEDSCQKLEDLEAKRKESYDEMCKQHGAGTSKLTVDSQVMDIAKRNPSRLSVPELLEELQVTKNELENLKAMYRQLMEAKSKNKIDPEITLQFLKSAIYYFLTDKENTSGHLKAIQSILGFSQNEITNIDKAQFQ
ncbi:putative leucine-rich repeat-containing protein DDB_G0290503 isoform X2 [Harmonia axyridis]|uniref:putative leucine-rich repeat-containing protein DDB_G0290503 isoform X2 n=1 Tax=Harmonia axyridis TaxID=115357 RepID=UPI001E278AB3|nr:putative leucine-rich repeat-containing protein DDB_G0290503 isoform X2 [Harmonia axyridis]